MPRWLPCIGYDQTWTALFNIRGISPTFTMDKGNAGDSGGTEQITAAERPSRMVGGRGGRALGGRSDHSRQQQSITGQRPTPEYSVSRWVMFSSVSLSMNCGISARIDHGLRPSTVCFPHYQVRLDSIKLSLQSYWSS